MKKKWGRNKKDKTFENIRAVHKCCWRRNKCPRIVPAKSTKYGFKNNLEYDVMACKCDNMFKKCLKEEKSYIADSIGHRYFDSLRIPCLAFYPLEKQNVQTESINVSSEPNISAAIPIVPLTP